MGWIALLALVALGVVVRRPTPTTLRGAVPEGTRVVPPPPKIDPRDEEALDVWGFRDTQFVAQPDDSVILTGDRYELSGKKLPHLVPWVRDVMGAPDIRHDDVNVGHYPPAVPAPVRNDAFTAALKGILTDGQISDDARTRLRHNHGHTQEEVYEIKFGAPARVPDVVLYPETEAQVVSIVSAAKAHDAVLIPFGGGTNVTDALRCPAGEPRFIASVDMRRMNRILYIDTTNRTAKIEAGAVGRHITAQLAEYGFTMGHEPDSVEFSTLGGWIATRASGMKKNRYGNIEDLVLDVNLVTADGLIQRPGFGPRESIGVDARTFALGSEGNFGIITSAVVKLFPLPEAVRYGSILFPSFEDGVDFMYDITQAGAVPASVRLVDNLQFQFSMALKPAKTGLGKLKSAFEKLLVTKVMGFDPQKMVACTLVFEGGTAEVEAQERAVYDIASKHGGMKAGAENGSRGYQLTFGIAYIRDFVMRHHVIGESFETSVPWSAAVALVERVKRRVAEEHAARKLPGRPFITARVTQVYPTGVCIYFYLAFYCRGVAEPSHTFAEIEAAARDEVLAAGGSLSHHHGVGKLRKPFVRRVLSRAAVDWVRRTKQAVDPGNVFGAGNHVVGDLTEG